MTIVFPNSTGSKTRRRMSSTLRTRTAMRITRAMVVLIVGLPLLLPLLLRQWDHFGGTIMIAEAFHPSSNAAASSSAFPISTRSSRPGQSRTITPATTITTPTTTQTQMRIQQTQLFCICVDCKWVTSCKAYHFVEKKHEQPHMSEEPTFLPREGSPTINVNIRTEQRTPKPKAGVVDKTDDALARMWKDQIREDNDEQGDGESNSDSESNSEPKRDARYYEETGTIEAINTNTTTTIEYDVVKCADFVLDKGCWIRNMPEEMKRVNPDFVPT